MPASVSLSIAPTRPYDTWRQTIFGGGSAAPFGLPAQNSDAGSLANLLEFALAADPLAFTPAPPLTLAQNGSRWEVSFQTRRGYGSETFLTLESSPTLDGTSWTALAKLNDYFPALNRLAPGLSLATSYGDTLRQYRLVLPAVIAQKEFFRLRATQEKHPQDP